MLIMIPWNCLVIGRLLPVIQDPHCSMHVKQLLEVLRDTTWLKRITNLFLFRTFFLPFRSEQDENLVGMVLLGVGLLSSQDIARS
jgi:hypothetical protein